LAFPTEFGFQHPKQTKSTDLPQLDFVFTYFTNKKSS